MALNSAVDTIHQTQAKLENNNNDHETLNYFKQRAVKEKHQYNYHYILQR